MPQRILVVGTSFGGGNWSPLAAVTMGLSGAGHEVQCFGDRPIAHDFASAASAIDVVQAEAGLGTFAAQWVRASDTGPSPFGAWAEACLPVVHALVNGFKPQIGLSDLHRGVGSPCEGGLLYSMVLRQSGLLLRPEQPSSA
jgi:hypothetical protein